MATLACLGGMFYRFIPTTIAFVPAHRAFYFPSLPGDLVVIADAVDAEMKPGTLCVYCEENIGSFQAQLRLTSHDPGVWASLAQLRLAGHAPSEVIVVGAVPESCGLGEDISASVQNTCLAAVDTDRPERFRAKGCLVSPTEVYRSQQTRTDVIVKSRGVSGRIEDE